MNDRDYPNSGIMFRNEKKRDGDDRRGDYKGTADIDCPHCGARSQFWLSAWIKQGHKGKFMSVSFKAKDGGGDRHESGPQETERDIPF